MIRPRRTGWKTALTILVVGVTLTSAAARAATLSSPLHFPVRSDGAVRRSAAAGELPLDLDRPGLENLRRSPSGEQLRLEDFPFFPGATGTLLLERFEVATPDSRILVQTAKGPASLPMPQVTHFRGRLEADPESRVYVGVTGNFLVGLVKTSAGLAYVGPNGPPDDGVSHVLRRADSPLNAELAPLEWRCDADALQAPADVPRSGGTPTIHTLAATSTLEATALKQATISIETDQEMLAKFNGNVSALTSYINMLVGQISVIYERDVAVHLAISAIQVWSTTDPYSAGDPMGQLNEVGDWWHANRPKSSYPRTLVHFMSGKPVSGGVAWLDVLCMNDFSQGGHWGGAYGVTQVNGAYPASLWDLIAVAHELGHNFGSPHTHCFSPPIDKCYSGEGGCYSGPLVNPGAQGGTIMSYCHLLAGGYGNIDLRFHERCITEEMLPEIAAVTCLTNYSTAPPTALRFYTVTPCRAVDTRNPTGPYGAPALAANSSRTFNLAGTCGIPSTAKALSLNLLVTQPTATGNLRLYAAGTGLPMASAINYRAGQTRANSNFAPVGSGAGLAVRCDQVSGSVQAIIDVNGYFQ